jgi:lysophospholipase L1-like esterase
VAIPSEIVLRNIHRRQAGRHSSEYHPYLQAVPEPTGDSYMQINRWGFRGENIEKEKPPGAYRIFVLGGSTVYCDRVKFEQSHCRILEKLLQAAYPDVKIEVQNAGMHWHTSEHSLIKFLTDIQDFQPDAIVVFHGINDLCRSFSPPSYARPGYHDDYRHYYGAVARMVESNGGDRPLIDSFALNTLTSFVSRYWFSDFRNPVHVPERPVSEWKSLPAFRRNLRSLSDTVQSQGIALVVASQPSFYKTEMSQEELARLELTNSICRDIEFRPDRNSLIAGMQAFNAASRQIADQTGALFVDLAAAVPKTTEFFVDDVHYLPAGNRVVGETLARAIIESGIIESPDKAKSAEAQ